MCKGMPGIRHYPLGGDGMKKHRYDYLWIFSLVYLILGFFNILFAWIGLLCFFIPLFLSIVTGTKLYCNRYCGRGRLFSLIGGKLGLSRKKDIPPFVRKPWFRYGFLIFFLTMFFLMLWNTWLVFSDARSLKEVVTVLWTFKVPWHWAYRGSIFPDWAVQFAFGFYSIMLTSTVLGLITMIFFKPRSWCVYCPMGTMTQLICRLKSKGGMKRRTDFYRNRI
jgi:polyferredoxin